MIHKAYDALLAKEYEKASDGKHPMKCLRNFQGLMLELWFRVFARDANSPYKKIKPAKNKNELLQNFIA
ncbi:MAG: hypothetical protein QG564_51 [Campylobacterota bacterium]|nr:hypothetical protein [Campylobacterota bacterium]